MTGTRAAAPAAIERWVELRAAPERVWAALTEPAELEAWFTRRAAFELRPGAEGWLEWEEHGRFAVRVEVVDPPGRFSWRWARDPDVGLDEGVSTLVEWSLERRPDGGTRLRVRESGFERPEDRRINAWGWLDAAGELAKRVADEPWQAGISRTYRLRSDPGRVWRAFADPVEFGAWWGGRELVALVPGTTGWWDWPGEGRFAVRIDAVEPPTYLSWTWSTAPDVPIDSAPEVLHTEWLLVARDDGGTDLHLLETGFTGPREFRLNDAGWDGDVIPALRRVLGEGEPSATVA
jgi:uncharacterized protein YndB with AHSA1/START domain